MEKEEITLFEKYKNISNKQLLADYAQAELCGENCLRIHSIDAHGHFHTARELRQLILERMTGPEIVKIRVK